MARKAAKELTEKEQVVEKKKVRNVAERAKAWLRKQKENHKKAKLKKRAKAKQRRQ